MAGLAVQVYLVVADAELIMPITDPLVVAHTAAVVVALAVVAVRVQVPLA
jgi:hypothetical protein